MVSLTVKYSGFLQLHNEIKCVLSVKESNFSEKKYHICFRSGTRWLTPPLPLTVSLTVKYPLFFTSRLSLAEELIAATFYN